MLVSVTAFLIQILFNLYLFVIILRLLLQMIQADYRNPLSQFTLKLTGPVVAPLQKIIPEFKGVDVAVLVLALLVASIKFILLALLQLHVFPNLGAVLLLAVIEILDTLISLYFWAIILRVIMSWLLPLHHNPIFFLVTRLVEPVLRPIRQIVPLVGGFDLSPLIALILLEICSFLLAFLARMIMGMLS